ncbi:MAG: CvpA family protein [Treponema sp.]|jgi:membrane protein required for colicin V production|nr:CvpA family protein [Treponema sp.]
MTEYAPIDIVLAILGLLMIFRGFVRGFVKEFFSLGAVVFGILGSILLYKNGAAFLRSNYMPDIKAFPELLAFIAVFIIIFLLCKILQKILNDIIKGLSLDAIDRVLGGIFGLAEGIAAVSLLLFVIAIQPVFDSHTLLEGSFLGRLILPIIIDASPQIIRALPHSAFLLLPANEVLG